MWPPMGSPLKSKLISMYLPNREELSLRLVLALPKASKMSLDCNKTFLARSISFWPDTFVTAAMYLKQKLFHEIFHKKKKEKMLGIRFEKNRENQDGK